MIMKATKISGPMGRTRKNPFPKPKKTSERFVARLHQLLDRTPDRDYDDVADKCGVSKAAVQRWFTGTDVPHIDRYDDIAKFFGVEVHELFTKD